MLRLIIQSIFSKDTETRYQAVKKLYWKLPIPVGVKQKLRYFLSSHIGFMRSRNRAAASLIGKGIKIQCEVSGSRTLRRKIARKPEDDKCRILVASTWIPEPDKNSGSVRLFSIIELFKQRGLVVTFVSLASKKHHKINNSGTESFDRNHHQLADICEEVVYGRDSIGVHLAELGFRYKYIFLSFPDVAYELLPTVRAYCLHAKVIYDTVDLHHLRLRRESELLNDEFLRERADYYEKIERACSKNVDAIVAITDDEKDRIIQISGNTNVDVVPNIHNVVKEEISQESRKGLLFIGNYQHTPNQDAVVYFADKVLPLITKIIPDITFTILGCDVTPEVSNLKGAHINVVGYVKDPTPYFMSHQVFVAPLRYGAGMKGKVGQSMCLGLPVVTTSIGAEGMGLEHGKDVLIADSAEEFADTVIRLYKDESLWHDLSVRGLEYIESNYSYDAVSRSLDTMFNRLSGQESPDGSVVPRS